MTPTSIHRLLTAMLLALVACPAFAQDKIVKIMDELEKKFDVTTTYSERRTKKKHKLYRTTRVLNFSNQSAYYRRLEKAFEAERSNSISAVKSNSTFSYKFADEKGESTFTLTPSSVVMTWRDVSVPDNEGDGSYMPDVRGVEGLADLSDIGDNYRDEFGSLRRWAKDQRQWAEKQRKAAEKQRKAAEKQRKVAEKQRKAAEKQRKEAARQREKACKQRNSAQTTVTTTVITDSYGNVYTL